eukprot:5270262-Karenia_brevis.AAC.1
MEMYDKWHAKNTPDNLATMSGYIVRHLKELPLYHMRGMSLPELIEDEARPFEESIRKGYLGWLQSQTDRAK